VLAATLTRVSCRRQTPPLTDSQTTSSINSHPDQGRTEENGGFQAS